MIEIGIKALPVLITEMRCIFKCYTNTFPMYVVAAQVINLQTQKLIKLNS